MPQNYVNTVTAIATDGGLSPSLARAIANEKNSRGGMNAPEEGQPSLSNT